MHPATRPTTAPLTPVLRAHFLSALVKRLFPWNIRAKQETLQLFGRGFAVLFERQIRDRASHFASLQFSNPAAGDTKAAKWRLMSHLIWSSHERRVGKEC